MTSFVARALILLSTFATFAVGAAPASAASKSGIRNARYCEVLVARGALPAVNVQVFNTIGLNDCPPALWGPLNAKSLATELGALAVVLNGPRHWMMDKASAPKIGVTQDFHGLKARLVATLTITTAPGLVQTPYTERTVNRDNTWTWKNHRTVFELLAPGGKKYVMQAYSQIKDPNLTIGQLPALGSRLGLPTGWRYRMRTLRKPLVMKAGGKATIVQDELQNTYQLER